MFTFTLAFKSDRLQVKLINEFIDKYFLIGTKNFLTLNVFSSVYEIKILKIYKLNTKKVL